MADNDNKNHKALNRLFTSAFIFLYIFSCVLFVYLNSKPDELTNILQKGSITVITRNNPQCYMLGKDQIMGFEYELAKLFADYLGVDLKINPDEKWDSMISALNSGRGSFIAANMTITNKRQQQAAFSNGYISTRQYVIVRRNNTDIKKVEDLAGKTVHVRKGTSYQKRLELIKKDGIDITIKLHDNTPTYELIQQVAKRTIEATVADQNIALFNRKYYPRATPAFPISDDQYLGWAVKQSSKKLLNKINLFFDKINANGKFDEIYNKYYAGIDNFDYVDLIKYHIRLKTRLPKYRPIIMEAAEKHDFDWKLIAAQIYQESHFDPLAASHSGAFGLMQLMFSTAASLGVEDLFDPVQNINAGVLYLKILYDHFDKADSPDRLYLALAAYNIGQGHILDARNLARQTNLDPDKWQSLKKTLPLLQYRKYYKNSKYGYCIGTQTLNYIKQIMLYYDILQHREKYHLTAAMKNN